ncbi:MAG: Wzz/FepE/Etk N-terminal domain-containing protein [Caldilineaceae bacterium]
MELLYYWNIIRKRLWLLWLFGLLALAGAGYYVLSQPPQYRTSTTLAISPSALNSAVNFETGNQLVPLANTYSEFMKSRSFAQLVQAELQQQTLPVQPTELKFSMRSSPSISRTRSSFVSPPPTGIRWWPRRWPTPRRRC